DEVAARAPVQAAPPKDQPTSVYDVHDLLDVPDAQQGPLTSDQRNALQDLVKTITAQVRDPDYTISSFNGLLVVSATNEVHESIRKLLDSLHMAHSNYREDVKQHLQKATTGPLK